MAERVTREATQRQSDQEPAREFPIAKKVGNTAVDGSTEGPDILDSIDELLEEEKLSAEGLDRLLDEIDAVLEEKPEEVVASYVQRGGE